MSVWQQAWFLVLGALISGLIGASVGELGRWRERQEARRRRQRQALQEFNGPLLRLLVELSRQLDQGPDAEARWWIGNTRNIEAADTWIPDDRAVANTLDWEPSRRLAQEVERAWSDRVRLEVFDPVIRSQVEAVRKPARLVGLSPDTPGVASELRHALQKLLEMIAAELARV